MKLVRGLIGIAAFLAVAVFVLTNEVGKLIKGRNVC